ncbi:LysR family transcriptional regulator [Actinotalea sp. BY-33]|uniref:LysR family transcriptional regulator n=1 Tax=Actinotalea soli TaxID=2819234 RepID=A0A939RUZ4_9CELL|nr:LysR substrate-binding domain-containing protein [Actinotalea soli]MBO1751870.1 LysR family transcriptional regulator [Actinotalea soli]
MDVVEDGDGTTQAPAPAAFRLAMVPGTTPGRWLRTWGERSDLPVELVHVEVADQLTALREGLADAALVRLHERPEDLSAIPLYTETSVVVVPRDHLVTAAEEVTAQDLTEETRLVPADDVLAWTDGPGEPSLLPTPPSTAEAVELVAAGVGVLVVPQSLARLHQRRDLASRPVADAPTSTVQLAWCTDRTTEEVETFVGIVRGRTANSSRGPRPTSSDEGPSTPATGRGSASAGRGRRAATTRRGGAGRSGGTTGRRRSR